MPDPPLNPRIALYASCFSRAMESDCPPDERARYSVAMALLVPSPSVGRRPRVRRALLGDLIRETIDERLHGEP